MVYLNLSSLVVYQDPGLKKSCDPDPSRYGTEKIIKLERKKRWKAKELDLKPPRGASNHSSKGLMVRDRSQWPMILK